MVGASVIDKIGFKKGAWSPEEDEKLVAFIKRHGHWNWRELPKYAGLLRCGKSCRLRWMNYLRPNIKRGNYSREEEAIIINEHQSLGNKWAAIAAKLPGRTDNEIKNHWHTHLKKRLKRNPVASEAKLHPEKHSELEASKRESEPNILLPNASTDQTFISSPLSPQPSSSDFSCLSTDFPIVTSTSWVAYENIVASEKVAEVQSGNFWTNPLLAGNSYIQEDSQGTSIDPGLLFPPSPESLGESLFIYDLYNDYGIDWFN